MGHLRSIRRCPSTVSCAVPRGESTKFGGFPAEKPTNKATASKPNLRGISLSEYGLEVFQVRLKRLSEYGSDAYLVKRSTRETHAEQYSDPVLIKRRVCVCVCVCVGHLRLALPSL